MKKRQFIAVLSASVLALNLIACQGQAANNASQSSAETSTKVQADQTSSRPDMPPGGSGGGPGGVPPQSSSTNLTYSGAVEITSGDSQSDQTYSSTQADESALLIAASEEVSIANPTVTKTGDSDGGDNCNFYGLNAAVLVKISAT